MIDSRDIVWRELHWPTPLDSNQALSLIRRLASDHTRQPVIFEAHGVEGHVSHSLGTAAHQVREISDLAESLVPGVSFSAADTTHTAVPPAARVKLSRPTLSLHTDRAPQAARSILAALASAHFRTEEAVVQITLGVALPSRLSVPKPADPTQSWLSLLAHGGLPPSAEVTRGLRSKDNEPGFRAVIRVSASAKSEGRRVAIVRGLLAAFRTLQASGTGIEFVRDRSALDQLPRRGWVRLTSSEVLGLIGWPLDADDLPGMPEPHPKLLRLTANDIETKRVFATTNAPGESKPVGIAIEDALFHTVFVGPTGVGKSTSMLNLIRADLKAGHSVVVIDPKKDLVNDVLQRVPDSRANDTIVLDPTDKNPVGPNPFHTSDFTPELVADGLLGIFRDLFPSAFGPRTSDVLHASLLTLAHHPGATLVSLPRLLTDPRFRRSLTRNLNDPDGLESFWAQYDELSERQQAQHIGPVLSRLRQFLLRPSLKAVLDQSGPRFDLRDLFNSRRVLLVPLNSGLLGTEASRLLGSLLVSQLWQLTLARADQPKKDRVPVSIYIDEAQEFLHLGGELPDALARSRSLGVAWHLAHQYRSQMTAETRAAIDANARNKIVFTLGIDDAKAMAAMTTDLGPEDFMTLPEHAVYTSLMRRGKQLNWVSAQALPAPPVTSNPVDIVARSQARYGRLPVADPDVSTSDAGSDVGGSVRDSGSSIGRKRRTT